MYIRNISKKKSSSCITVNYQIILIKVWNKGRYPSPLLLFNILLDALASHKNVIVKIGHGKAK